MRYGSVYLIENKINGHKYVGLTTTSVEARWASHKCETSTCTYLHKALKKYGIDNFIVIELASSWSKGDLEELESWFILYYNCAAPNGYNLTTGGGFHGKQCEITKSKKSEFHKKDWKRFKNDKNLYDKRMAGINSYIVNKRQKIIGVCMSTGNVCRYPSYYTSIDVPSNIYNAIKYGFYSKNFYWFRDIGQQDAAVRQQVLSKLKGRWQPENIYPILGENIDSGEVFEFENIFHAKKILSIGAGSIRKCFTGRVTRVKRWKFRLK